MNIGDLRQRQSLPLEMKIQKSTRTIEDFYELTDGNCYISTSGADSSVLDWICKQTIYDKKIERVSVAGAEPRENIKLLNDRGDTLLKCVADKKQIITEWGYPIISKSQAMCISRYHRGNEEVKEKRLNGYIGDNGKLITDGKISNKYKELIYAPFEVSEKCCDKFKKRPLMIFHNKTKKHPITAELASESRNRQQQYLKHGCILNSDNKTKCTPLGFWTKQDILKCIKNNNIPISSLYGEVVEKDGELKFSKEQRTGCNICGFGLLYDLERLDRLKELHPKEYEHMMNGGQWIQKDIYRPMRFYWGGPIEVTNWYWVPSKEGYGYREVLEYVFCMLNINKKI